MQKPWAKPAGNPAAHVQQAASSESRQSPIRRERPCSNAALTASLPALKLETNFRRLAEQDDTTINPLTALGGSAMTPRAPSTQASLVRALPPIKDSSSHVCQHVATHKGIVHVWGDPHCLTHASAALQGAGLHAILLYCAGRRFASCQTGTILTGIHMSAVCVQGKALASPVADDLDRLSDVSISSLRCMASDTQVTHPPPFSTSDMQTCWCSPM